MSKSTTPGENEAQKIRQMFDDAFDTILKDLLSDPVLGDISQVAKNWYKDVLEYNVPFGKKNRGLMVVKTFLLLSKPEDVNDDNKRLACYLGWCIELLQAFFLIADDIMDQSVMRRGKPCWYKKDDNGLIAFNDSVLGHCAIFRILKKYFKNTSYYVHLLEVFNETTFQTALGQCSDLLASNKVPAYDKFTDEYYSSVVQFKTAYYSFYLPVAVAMYMAGHHEPEKHREALEILLGIGHFFQVQDDYLDCFGDVAATGKGAIGKDIEEGKCSWLAVNALQLATDMQKITFKNNYGYDDPLKVERIRNLYVELDLVKLYESFEQISYDKLTSLINGKVELLPKEIFVWALDKIFKRQK
ncbi:FDPS (predicted) [Pycnogonum litorale]